MQSCIRAEICVISYLLPVNGRHRWFTTYPNTEQHHYFLLRVLWHWKRWNCVAIMYYSCDTCNYIISAAIMDFWLPVSSGSVTYGTIEMFDPENMEVAVGILFTAILEAEIPPGVVLLPLQHKRHKNNLQHMRVNINIDQWLNRYNTRSLICCILTHFFISRRIASRPSVCWSCGALHTKSFRWYTPRQLFNY